ncbi:thiamine pyrophosphate-binding protein [Brevibacterium yomogidense]|uniref:thiamine pyrophosphate-binding protein n=1 Tax=Brevibacterium yomogidense TaxID=946573 RepID=UPI0018DF2C85|nr:thiamine pyrophosphate-binding protein [Brevibacterium yomogidense]
MTDANDNGNLAYENGGLAVVAALAAHGVDTVFGIPGTHNLEFYRHLHRFGIRAITPRHEQGAGYAADGYFVVSGRPGVVITTSGPGLTNVITAAATAYAESRPMLILSPGVPTGLERADVGMLHETKDSSGALSHLLVAAHRTRTAEGAAQAIADAFALFEGSRPGPVHIEVPLDVLEGGWHGTTAAPWPSRPRPLDEDAVDTAAEALAGSVRPLIIAGGGARRAADRITRLAELLDAPVATTANGKGIVDETHPLAVGANVRFPSVQQASREADVLLVLGTEIADSDLWGGMIGIQEENTTQTVIRCDIDPDQLHKNLRGQVLVLGDATAFVDGLLTRLGKGDGSREDGTARAAQLRREVAHDFDATHIGARVTALVQEAAGHDVVIAGDSSRVTYDGTVHALVARTPDQLLYMPGYATLGYGIPAAIGGRLAAPDRPVACIVGDGAAMFAIQEIATAVELALPIPFVIVDNGGYEEIEHQMVERGIEPFAVRLHRPDFALLAESMGARGATVAHTDLDEHLPREVRTALAADRPTVIHVLEQQA